jgi:hypothetical protein
MATEKDGPEEREPTGEREKDSENKGVERPAKRKDEPPHLPPGAMGDWATL